MKKTISTICMCALIVTCMISCESQDISWAFSNKSKSADNARQSADKVTICHRDGNGSSHTITVNISAWAHHQKHGDSMGDCDAVTTPE
jgi:hypothetical protein